MQRLMFDLSKLMALFGGAVLLAIMATTFLSIVGRSFNTIAHYEFLETNVGFLSDFLKLFGPINGDFELVEAGVAIAIFSFLPWCQLKRGHAKVDVFTNFMNPGANRFLSVLWEAVFAFVLVLITWRLYVGMGDKLRYGETTLLLQMPVWWAFAVCFVAAMVASIVGVYSVYLSIVEGTKSDRLSST